MAKAKSSNNINDEEGGEFKTNQNKNNGIKFVKSRKIHQVDEGTKTLRRLYNRLMQKPKDNKKISKPEIVKSIMKHVNNNYDEICFKHDGCRILQGSIKYGDKKQREEIIGKLLPHVFKLIIGKYSIFLASKIFKYAKHEQKEKIIKETLFPNFRKLLKAENGKAFMRVIFAYSPASMHDMMVEYYLNNYLKLAEEDLKKLGSSQKVKEEEGTSSSNIIVESKDLFDYSKVQECLKSHLEKQLELKIHQNYLFQAFLNKVFNYLDYRTKAYISELFDDDISPFIDNHDGIELSCKIYAAASAKTRKKVIKLFKDNFNDLILTENASLLLIKMILFTDDTKVVEKHLLKFLLEKFNEGFTSNKILCKVFSNIFSPFNKKANHPLEVELLSYTEQEANKKELAKRQNEVIHIILEDVVKYLCFEMKFFLTDPIYSEFLIDVIIYLDNADGIDNQLQLETIVKSILSTVESDYASNSETIDMTILSDKKGHLVIKRIIKDLMQKENETTEKEEVKLSFIKGIVKVLVSNLEQFLCTKAIFIIIQVLELPKIKKLLAKDVKKYKETIAEKAKDKTLKGFQILNNLQTKL